MRISIDLKGYYEWVPVPEGTTITEDDKKSLRVKFMQDEKWHMKVPMKVDDVAPNKRHFDCGIHESTIAEVLAANAKLGKDISREEWVAQHLRDDVFKHHIHRSHCIQIHVDDDGPNEALYRSALERVGVADENLDFAMAAYLASADVAAYLNQFFKTDHHKKESK